MKLGSHVSIKGGLISAAKEAFSYNSDTFMIYTGSPRSVNRLNIDNLKIQEGHDYMKKTNLSDIVVHAPYIINLASYKTNTFKLAIEKLADEINRTEKIKSNYLVLHPGSYTDKNLDFGIKRIAEGLNSVLTKNTDVFICLETMSGKGTEVGSSFEELKRIIDKVVYNEKIAVCFDTCHTHDSGYDIVNEFDKVINNFDNIIGLNKLKVFHINGSLNPIGSKKDRHANIGADEKNPKGKDYIGLKAIRNIVHHEIITNQPLILETPWLNDNTNLYKEEIELLRKKN